MDENSIENEIQGQILTGLSRDFSVTEDPAVKEQLLSEIDTERISIRRWLTRDNPFKEAQGSLQRSEQELENENTATTDQLEEDLHQFQALAEQTGSRIDSDYWLSEIEELKAFHDLPDFVSEILQEPETTTLEEVTRAQVHEKHVICRRLLLQQWRKLLDGQFASWEIETIRKYREKLLSRLREWLRNLQLLSDTLDELSIEPGLLFDLSKGNLSLSNIEQLRRWAEYISNDKGVKELCDMLGRLRRAERTTRQELVKHVPTVTQFVPDVNSREEIVGVYIGKDVERAVPQEMAVLSDDETAILFDLKLAEGRLMCFEMEGTRASSLMVEEERMVEIEEEEKLGPMIICVDTSGSMQGSPETIAKAVTLFVATRAMSQKRNCLLINFSTGIETLDLSEKMDIAKVIGFLQRSFHGGTDVRSALDYALNMMDSEEYNRSDLLVISDFVMSSVPEPVHERILIAKKNQSRFHALSIGDLFLSKRLRKVFDNEWVYNPSNSHIGLIQDVGSTVVA